MRTDRLKIIILLCSLALVLPFLCLTAEGKDFTVVIDPGHGGHDHRQTRKRKEYQSECGIESRTPDTEQL